MGSGNGQRSRRQRQTPSQTQITQKEKEEMKIVKCDYKDVDSAFGNFAIEIEHEGKIYDGT
jgi:hypothetical protein